MTKNWISFNALIRNALIVLGNYKDKRALKHLEELKKENNPYLEKYINRAIKNINKK